MHSTKVSGITEGKIGCTNTGGIATAERGLPSEHPTFLSSLGLKDFAPHRETRKDYVGGLSISTGIFIRDIQEINLRGIIKANRSYEEPLGFGYFMEGLLRICRYRSLFILD